MLNLTDEVTFELANLGMVSLALKLMHQQDYLVQLNAVTLFKHVTERHNILGEIIANEDLHNLIGKHYTGVCDGCRCGQ